MNIEEKVELIKSKTVPIIVGEKLEHQIHEVCYTLSEFNGEFPSPEYLLRCVEIYNMLASGGYEEDMRM